MKPERDGDYMVELSKTLWAAQVGDAMAKFKAEILASIHQSSVDFAARWVRHRYKGDTDAMDK